MRIWPPSINIYYAGAGLDLPAADLHIAYNMIEQQGLVLRKEAFLIVLSAN